MAVEVSEQQGEGATANGSGTRRLARLRSWVVAHPLLSIFALALLVRIVAAILINTLSGGILFNDDSTYSNMARSVVHGDSVRWDQYTTFLYNRAATFTLPLTALYYVTGPVQLVGQLLAATYGAVAAVLTTRVGREFLTPRWAMAAGAVVALLPSQVLFSSLTLKDAAVWAALAGLALAVTLGGRLVGWRLLLAGVATVVCLVLLAHLRIHTLVMASWALALASWGGRADVRARRVAGALVIAVLVPWGFGAGPGGYTLAHAAGSLENIRVANAFGAATAFVRTPKAASVKEVAKAQERVQQLTVQANALNDPKGPSGPRAAEIKKDLAKAEEQLHVLTAAPSVNNGADEFGASLKHLPRGLSVMLVEPFLWQVDGNSRVQMAAAELVLWYPLIALAVIGIVTLLRQRRLPLFPFFALLGITLLYGLAEGNFGTAYRHRGEMVWALALFAAAGGQSLAERRT